MKRVSLREGENGIPGEDISTAFRRSSGLRGLTLLAIAVLTLGLVACGGGSKAENTPTPPPTPTVNAVDAYRQAVTTQGKKLDSLMDGLNNDMQAAAVNQADPKWPGVLTTDFKLVADAATTLGNLQPPNDTYKDFDASLDAATAKVLEGTQLLAQSIAQQDATAGAQAFAALTQGRTMLDAALAAMPAQ